MTKWFIGLALLATLSGCVGKKKYDALESALTTTQTDRDAQLGQRDAEIAELHGKVASLEAAIKQAELALQAREKQLEEARETSSKILADKGALATEVSRMKAALAELEARKAQTEARLKEFRDLLSRFKSLIDAGTLQVKIQDGRMVVALATDVLFASGSASLSDDGKKALTEVAQILAGIPDRSFQVEGHTDNVPIKTAQFPDNWALASARSLNVVQHLIANGMAGTSLSGASYADQRPVVSNDTKENRALNRRIEIVVVPDLSQLPGYDELQALSR